MSGDTPAARLQPLRRASRDFFRLQIRVKKATIRPIRGSSGQQQASTYVKALSALELKIQTFLHQAGVPVDPSAPSSLQLVRYFEAESGCHILALLEQEYWAEQVEMDFGDSFLGRVRSHLDDDQWRAFDGLFTEQPARHVEVVDGHVFEQAAADLDVGERRRRRIPAFSTHLPAINLRFSNRYSSG